MNTRQRCVVLPSTILAASHYLHIRGEALLPVDTSASCEGEDLWIRSSSSSLFFTVWFPLTSPSIRCSPDPLSGASPLPLPLPTHPFRLSCRANGGRVLGNCSLLQLRPCFHKSGRNSHRDLWVPDVRTGGLSPGRGRTQTDGQADVCLDWWEAGRFVVSRLERPLASKRSSSCEETKPLASEQSFTRENTNTLASKQNSTREKSKHVLSWRHAEQSLHTVKNILKQKALTKDYVEAKILDITTIINRKRRRNLSILTTTTTTIIIQSLQTVSTAAGHPTEAHCDLLLLLYTSCLLLSVYTLTLLTTAFIMGNEGSALTGSESSTPLSEYNSMYSLGSRVRSSVESTRAPSPQEAPEPDLSHLSEDEVAKIRSVMDRAKALQEEEQTRAR
ncbi:hypothetical protein ACOMHN_038612 [Nucella lapillus]